jgi:uncharacterized protein YecE (DUF72 family)
MGFVNIDAPSGVGQAPASILVTSHFAYFRLHGRNELTWSQCINPNRYDYSYSENELAELAEQIRKAVEQVDTVLVVFNNRWGGKAVKNAMRIKAILK